MDASDAPDSLLAAEHFLASISSSHVSLLGDLRALRESLQHRVSALEAAKVAAETALDEKRKSYANNLRDVKMVAARMVQDREAAILALKRQLTIPSPPGPDVAQSS
jgi:NACalpha-BTF3-like transcription factor